jgi:hypothetical protein
MIDDAGETPQTTAPDDEIRDAFGGVIGTILDNYAASPARQAAIQEIIRAHERVLQMLSAPRAKSNGGLTGVWLRTKFH